MMIVLITLPEGAAMSAYRTLIHTLASSPLELEGWVEWEGIVQLKTRVTTNHLLGDN